MTSRIAEPEPLVVYSAVPQEAYVVVRGRRGPLGQRAKTTALGDGGRHLCVELRGALADLREPIEAGHVRLALTIGRTPDPHIEVDEVIVATRYGDVEDAPGLRLCFALIGKSAVLPLLRLDTKRIARALADIVLREVLP